MANAAASSGAPLTCATSYGVEFVTCQVIFDKVFIKEVKVNQGNCKSQYLVHNKEYKFADTFYPLLRVDCVVLEFEVITDNGSWTWNRTNNWLFPKRN
jgi:hypothetical protein